MKIPKFDLYRALTEQGLVRLRRDDGTLWWVGKAKAEDLVRTGKARLDPPSMDPNHAEEVSDETNGNA